jgi:hypothetical protein
MVFNVIQQKIFPLDRDKFFIQGTKTKKTEGNFSNGFDRKMIQNQINGCNCI